MGKAERNSKLGRYLAWVGAASILLSIAPGLTTGIATTCLDGGPGSSSGCTTEYLIDPLGLRLGEWFGVVSGAVLMAAVLTIIIGAGWLFQRYMDKKDARRLHTEPG